MLRMAAGGLMLLLAGCGGSTLPRPPEGYDAILFKQRVVLESVIDKYEVLAGSTLVAERLFEGRIYYCGLGKRNNAPAEVCLNIQGRDVVAYPGSVRELRATVPLSGMERTRV